jgi:hypothetical protein
MSEADQLWEYAQEAMQWAGQSTNRKREAGPARACAHMVASGGRKRGGPTAGNFKAE